MKFSPPVEEVKALTARGEYKVIAFDNLRQKIILIANMPLDAVQTNYNKATRELQQMADLLRHGTKKQEPPGKLLGEFTPLFDRAAYCAMVERARHHMQCLLTVAPAPVIPFGGFALLIGVRLRLAIYRGYGYNFLFFLIKISTLFYQAVI